MLRCCCMLVQALGIGFGGANAWGVSQIMGMRMTVMQTEVVSTCFRVT